MLDNKTFENDWVTLEDQSKSSRAIIDLKNGARLVSLQLDDVEVIEDIQPLSYENTYASAILFPFVNRIKDGLYRFRESEYQLFCNDTSNNCALHGLVYNREFEIFEQVADKDFSRINLVNHYDGSNAGYPFPFTLHVIYKISQREFTVSLRACNTGIEAMPYNMGWHPYFKSSLLTESFLNFNANKQLEFNEQLIPIGANLLKHKLPLKLVHTELDSGYFLNDSLIEFHTPEYDLKISSNVQENYLQVYIPPKENTIAIEPMTGVADSFNNNIATQILESGEIIQVSWSVCINTTNK